MQDNDLISRAAALDAIDHERDLLIEQKRFGAEHVVVHHARRLIEELPAVDAVPVVHGRWKKRKSWACYVCSMAKIPINRNLICNHLDYSNIGHRYFTPG